MSDVNKQLHLVSSCSSSTSSSTQRGGLKRPLVRVEEANNSGDCPLSSLVNIVKHHAKRLCSSTGCKEKNERLMVAANAACSAVTKLIPNADAVHSVQETSNKKTPGEQYCEDEPDGGVQVACMPLVDNESGRNECVPLVESNILAGPLLSPRLRKDSSTESTRVNYSEIMGELTCPICQEMLLHTRTLVCGHSFCEPCIDCWLPKCLTCPVCREDIESPPIASRTVDKTIELLIRDNKSAQLELATRDEAHKKTLQQDCEKRLRLECLMKKAESKGQRCLQISRPWSETEQNRFLKGLRLYRGSPRAAFCSLACLTECFVQRASLPDLMIAASNVKLGAQPQSANNGAATWDKMDANKLRSRLIMFIHYG